jgi:hypothetical protein
MHLLCSTTSIVVVTIMDIVVGIEATEVVVAGIVVAVMTADMTTEVVVEIN